MSQSDNQLVAAAVAGDTEALSGLLARYGPAVERALQISPLWQSVLDLSDVMQVTYLEAFLQIGELQTPEEGAFVTWLRRMADNNLRDAIRGLEREKRPSPRNRVQPASVEDSLTGLYHLLGETTTTPSRALNRQEIVAQLRDAIAALPPTYAEVIRLYDLEGLPIGDVAARLGRSTGAIHMLRARAHDQLRRRLGWTSAAW